MLKEKTLKIKKELYSKNVLLRASYTFIENYYFHLDSDENNWIINFKLKKDSLIQDIELIEGEFNNVLLNEALREAIAENTKTIKELIVARALYGADGEVDLFDNDNNFLVDNNEFSFIDEEEDDYLDDPLGIAVPWEEKYGKAKNKELKNDEISEEKS